MKPGVLLSIACLALSAFTPCAAQAADAEKATWLFSQNAGKTWCAYANNEDYRRAVGVQQPAETARVITFAGDVLELEYQITPPTGDWVVMDRYGYSGGKLALRRTTLLLLEGLEVVQETTISGAKAAPLKTISSTNLDGSKDARQPRSAPDVPVRTTFKAFAFLEVARKLEATGGLELCERVN